MLTLYILVAVGPLDSFGTPFITSAKSGGGKTTKLSCDEPLFLHCTQRCMRSPYSRSAGTIQCMNASCVWHYPPRYPCLYSTPRLVAQLLICFTSTTLDWFTIWPLQPALYGDIYIGTVHARASRLSREISTFCASEVLSRYGLGAGFIQRMWPCCDWPNIVADQVPVHDGSSVIHRLTLLVSLLILHLYFLILRIKSLIVASYRLIGSILL